MMSLSTQHDDSDTQYVMLAKLDNARNVSNILKAIHFKEVSNPCTLHSLIIVEINQAK